MNRTVAALSFAALALAFVLCVFSPAMAQVPSESDASLRALAARVSTLTQDDMLMNSKSAWALREEIAPFVEKSEYPKLLLLLSLNPRNSAGRGTVYHTILNTRKLTAADLPFLTQVFRFAVGECERDQGELDFAERRRGILTDRDVINMLGSVILSVLGQPPLIRDPDRAMLTPEPGKWLRLKLEQAQRTAKDAEMAGAIKAALDELSRGEK